MLRSRLIPCLLIQDGQLVKTVKFNNSKYVGDPLNAVKIFNEKYVDELMIIDISATEKGLEPNFNFIQKLADESRMPLSYGGGVKSLSHANKIISMGFEKICISSALIENPHLVKVISDSIGSQSTVVVLDVKKSLFGKYEIVTNRGKKKSKMELIECVNLMQDYGIGEIIINSVDCDGVMEGYDLKLINKIYSYINKPMTILGGAGSVDDFKQLNHSYGPCGIAAGSYFVFKGKFKAVLINYPSIEERKSIFEK